jgi:hypothetical protein
MSRNRTPGQLKYHREYMSRYRREHAEYRERVNRGRCARQKLNRVATSERWNGWYRKNAENINAKARENARKKRLKIIESLGGKCECCGETYYEFMSIDHRHGDGAAHRKSRSNGKNISLNSINFYNEVLREIASGSDRYRILCHNCNMARGFYGRCPHENKLEIVSGMAC